MRILIIGGDGMLGHQALATLSARHEVRATVRREPDAYAGLGLFGPENAFFGVDVRDVDRVAEALDVFRPEAVVNAAGIVKQRDAAKNPASAIAVNSLFPHQLASACLSIGARMVHLGTDCVFSGRRGQYREEDVPDADDLYGRSKLLGEVSDQGHCVTLRTSMIGLELASRRGLVEWFLASRGMIKGYRRAIFSGLTSHELTRVIERLLTRHRDLTGLWHLASAPIDKCSLLQTLSRLLGRDDVQIDPDEAFACDRSLDGSALARRIGYQAPGWDEMLGELADAVKARGN